MNYVTMSSTIFGDYTRVVSASENLQGLKMFYGIIPWNVSIKQQVNKKGRFYATPTFLCCYILKNYRAN